MPKLFNDIKVILVLCATLGFAPFYPEPHIKQQYVWWYWGGEGMKWVDYADFFLHLSPFLLLLRWVILAIKNRFFS